MGRLEDDRQPDGSRDTRLATRPTQDFETFVAAEISQLQQLMQTDRERYMTEIVFQHDNAPGYWVSLMDINNHLHPKTLIVMNLAVRIGQVVAAYLQEEVLATPAIIRMSRSAAGFRPAGSRLVPKRPFHAKLAIVAVPRGGGARLQGPALLACGQGRIKPRAGRRALSKRHRRGQIHRPQIAWPQIKAKCVDIPGLFGDAKLEWALSIARRPFRRLPATAVSTPDNQDCCRYGPDLPAPQGRWHREGWTPHRCCCGRRRRSRGQASVSGPGLRDPLERAELHLVSRAHNR